MNFSYLLKSYWLLILALFFFGTILIMPKATSNYFGEKDYKTTWIGNSFGGGQKWVQLEISSLYVSFDGTCFTNSEWDEAGREAGIYKQADIVGNAEDLHGWGRGGGIAVTANNKYLYVSMKQAYTGQVWRRFWQDYPQEKEVWYGVRLYNLNGKPVSFSGGRGYDQSMLILNQSSPITGLAANDKELYVSTAQANQVDVFDVQTLKKLRSLSVNHPGSLALDLKNNFWVIEKQSRQILNYSPQGQILSTINNVFEPTAIALDNQGRLLVAENGPAQQILIYDISKKPKIVDTLGVKGGIYAGNPGEVKADKLYGLSGIGADKQGNIYVSLNGFNRSGASLRKYTLSKNLEWELVGLQFLDCADVDTINDGVDVYTKDEHFVMDYSKDRGKEWFYRAYSVDPFRYPEDGRLHTQATAPFFRRIGGKPFLYLTDMYAQRLLMYRFEGEIAVPCGIFARKNSKWPENQPKKGMWLWQDQNGDGKIQLSEYQVLTEKEYSIWGWEVDTNGDVWLASESDGMWRYKFQGLDAYGSPIYHHKAYEKIEIPEPFNNLQRIKYIPETDTMYLSGYTQENAKTPEEWGIVGREIVRYDGWSQRPQMKWRLSLPHDLGSNPIVIVKAMDVAGDRVFAVTSRKAEVYVYNATTGKYITKLTPGPEVFNESGWIDIPYGLRAYQRKNGEYLVFVEEDSKAKLILYRHLNLD